MSIRQRSRDVIRQSPGAQVVSLFVANTDNDWFDFLSGTTGLVEIDFWQPGAKAFHAIEPGEILAFRLKSPRNRIGGFGVLSTSTILPLQIAWETFGASNGVPSYDRLREAIARYRPGENVGPTTNIGCRILVEPMFFPPDAWIELPESWSRNIVGGKRHSTDDSDGEYLWNRLQDATSLNPGFSAPRYGRPTLITPRLGQGAFRIAVTEAYGRQC